MKDTPHGTPRISSVDLLVIGGGPAGAAAAITARNSGAEVTIIEESRFPRFRPGETFHPGMEPLLIKLGANRLVKDAGHLRHAGTWIEWGDRREFIPFGEDAEGEWRGFQIPRAHFDMQLLEFAQELAVKVLQPVPAREIISSGGHLVGIETGDGPIHAPVVIDASGSRHWLARRLGVAVGRRSPKLVARYAYRSDAPMRCNRLPRISADASGWTWIADLGGSRFTWTRVTEPSCQPPKEWVPEDWPDAPAQSSRGADVTWRIAARTAGPGWFLCGDAAAVLDPSSSHGVLRAMMSGMLAAHYSVALLSGAVESAVVEQGYHEWMENWFQHDADKMARSYREARLFGY